MIFAEGTGELWIVPVAELSVFDAASPPTLSLGIGAVVSVDPAGLAVRLLARGGGGLPGRRRADRRGGSPVVGRDRAERRRPADLGRRQLGAARHRRGNRHDRARGHRAGLAGRFAGDGGAAASGTRRRSGARRHQRRTARGAVRRRDGRHPGRRAHRGSGGADGARRLHLRGLEHRQRLARLRERRRGDALARPTWPAAAPCRSWSTVTGSCSTTPAPEASGRFRRTASSSTTGTSSSSASRRRSRSRRTPTTTLPRSSRSSGCRSPSTTPSARVPDVRRCCRCC